MQIVFLGTNGKALVCAAGSSLEASTRSRLGILAMKSAIGDVIEPDGGFGLRWRSTQSV